jgi:hypothetical protein
MGRDLNSGNSVWESDIRRCTTSATEVETPSAASTTLTYGVHLCVSSAKYLRAI